MLEGLVVIVFLILFRSFAADEALVAIGTPILVLPCAMRWYRTTHERLRLDSLLSAAPVRAVRRLVLVPLAVFVGALGFSLIYTTAMDLKWSSFVWEALPAETVGGQAYAWPGVYATEALQHGDPPGPSWYVTGGPYVPQPDDTPDAAASRVVAYLHDRYDVDADPRHVAEVFSTTRDAPPPARLESAAGTAPHPYTAGMAALEDEYSGAVLHALRGRTLAVTLALVLAGAIVIRIGAGRPPAWISGRAAGIGAVAVYVGLAIAHITTDGSYALFQAAIPVFRFHAQHHVPIAATTLAIAALLLVSAHRRAKALAVELSRPA